MLVQDIMRRLSKMTARVVFSGILAAFLGVGLGTLCSAQTQAPQPSSGQTPAIQKQNGQYTLHANVNLVVLHATVVDKKGHMIDDLGRNDFRVYENGVPQKLAVFSYTRKSFRPRSSIMWPFLSTTVACSTTRLTLACSVYWLFCFCIAGVCPLEGCGA